METAEWYKNLIKPSFAPPSWVFGPVWIVLYSIIVISYSYLIYQVARKKISKKLLIPLFLNLISNFLFSPIQFKLQNNLLAAVDITVVLVSLVWLIHSLLPQHKFIAIAQVPYLLWVSFATILQYSITWLNR